MPLLPNDSVSLHKAQVTQLYSQGIAGIRGSFVAAVIMTAFLWGSTSHLRLIVWFVCYAAACGFGEFLFRAFEKSSGVESDVDWGRRFTALSIVGGVLWGTTPILLFPADSIRDQALLTFVLGGMSIGITISHSAKKSAHIPFIVAVYVPLIGRYFYEGTQPQMTMGLLLALFMTYLLGAAYRMNAMVTESLTLRFQNQGLLEGLTREKEKLRASLEEKEVLLREIHHRVKNNLQVISSLFRLESRYSGEKSSEAVLQDSQNRVLSLALVHEKLYQTKDMAHIDFGSYLEDLTKQLLGSIGPAKNRIKFEKKADTVLIPLDTAIPCGLIVNEIVSNSLRHAFPDGKAGVIRISLSCCEDTIELVISDNGIGLPSHIDCANPETFGLRLVETLVKQLRGDLTISRSDGTSFSMRLPAETRQSGAPNG